MEKRFYTSTNWLPWLGLGFVLSTIALGIVSNGWILLTCIVLSFLPAATVALALRGYFIIENNQLNFRYARRNRERTQFAIGLVDITTVRRVGKSVNISFDKNDDIAVRIHEAEAFVNVLQQQNPRIELVKD